MQGGVSVYCFRLVRRTLLSLQSPRLSQQTLRVDWRTCGQAWPPSLFCSHGTDSRPDIFPENMFFQLTFSGFNFWLNPLLWISTCFFFFLHWLVLFHGIGPTLQEMPGVFGIRWNHLWLLIFFLYSCWWGPGWLICGSSSVFCLTFSFCTWTRPDCLVHLFVLMQVLDGTLRSEIRNMCPSERSDVFLVFFFTTLGGSALGMTTLICQLVQTEISQQTQDRLPWNFFIDIHGAQRIIPADFSLSATMRLAFVVSSEVF